MLYIMSCIIYTRVAFSTFLTLARESQIAGVQKELRAKAGSWRSWAYRAFTQLFGYIGIDEIGLDADYIYYSYRYTSMCMYR